VRRNFAAALLAGNQIPGVPSVGSTPIAGTGFGAFAFWDWHRTSGFKFAGFAMFAAFESESKRGIRSEGLIAYAKFQQDSTDILSDQQVFSVKFDDSSLLLQ